MNNHKEKPACYVYNFEQSNHKCMAYGTPPNLEVMNNLTKGCTGCAALDHSPIGKGEQNDT